jgi:Uma2 family endonuclease
MAVLVHDPSLERDLKAEREATGADRWDEVWEGVYVMPPLPNDEHQQLAMGIGAIYQDVVGWPGLGDVRVGVNVSDRKQGWKRNYRAPDVAVFLKGGRAENCGTHWCGGPDSAVEILSPRDRTRDKLPFYARIGMRELLLIDRKPWKLELYELREGQLALTGLATLKKPVVLSSVVLPLTFQLLPGRPRPQIKVVHRDGTKDWTV